MSPHSGHYPNAAPKHCGTYLNLRELYQVSSSLWRVCDGFLILDITVTQLCNPTAALQLQGSKVPVPFLFWGSNRKQCTNPRRKWNPTGAAVGKNIAIRFVNISAEILFDVAGRPEGQRMESAGGPDHDVARGRACNKGEWERWGQPGARTALFTLSCRGLRTGCRRSTQLLGRLRCGLKFD